MSVEKERLKAVNFLNSRLTRQNKKDKLNFKNASYEVAGTSTSRAQKLVDVLNEYFGTYGEKISFEEEEGRILRFVVKPNDSELF